MVTLGLHVLEMDGSNPLQITSSKCKFIKRCVSGCRSSAMGLEWHFLALLVAFSGTVQQASCISEKNTIFSRAQASSEMKQVTYYLNMLRSSVETAISMQPRSDPTIIPLQTLLAIIKERIETKDTLDDLMDYLRVLDAGLEEAWHKLQLAQNRLKNEASRAVEIVIQFLPVTNGLVTDILRSLLADLNGHAPKWSSEEF